MVKMIARRIDDDARIKGGTILSAVSCQHAYHRADLKCSAGEMERNSQLVLKSAKRCGGEMEKEGGGGRGGGGEGG